MSYILAIDQGTTSSRSIIFDRDGQIVASGQKEFTQVYPQSGWVEHDPEEIWNVQIETAAQALRKSNLKSSDITALGITNQRETAIVWNRTTGKPVCNAIVWQDRRTSAFCNSLREEHADLIRSKTGLETDA